MPHILRVRVELPVDFFQRLKISLNKSQAIRDDCLIGDLQALGDA